MNKSMLWDLPVIVTAWAILVVAVALHPHEPWRGGLIAAPLWAMRYSGLHWPHWLVYSTIGSGLWAFTGLIFNPWREIRGDYGNAHFATKSEARKLALLDNTGLILGRWGNEFVRTAQPLSVLVFAPPESGKTAAIVIPSLLSCGNSMIVNDVKGELYAKTGGRRREFSRVIKFAPGEDGSTRWNPLSASELPERWDDRVIVVGRLSGALIPTPPGAKDPMWTTEARALFKFFALLLLWRDGETSLPDVRGFALSTGDVQGHIAELLDEHGDKLPRMIREEGNGMLAKADKEFAGVFGTFKSAMDVFSDPRVAENTSVSDFSLMDLRREVTTVYLCVSNADQSRLAPILGLFFEVATLNYIRREVMDDEISVTYMLDEFPRLGKLEQVVKMPAISRSYRVNAIFITQSQAQLEGAYGREGLDELKNTCAYHVVFSQNELKVAEEISKAIGNYTRKKQTRSDNDKRLSGSSHSDSYEGHALVMPQEIMSMDRDTILILRQNAFERPVKCSKAWWFKDSALKPLVGIPFDDEAGPVQVVTAEPPAEAPAVTTATAEAPAPAEPVAEVAMAAPEPAEEESAPDPAVAEPAEERAELPESDFAEADADAILAELQRLAEGEDEAVDGVA